MPSLTPQEHADATVWSATKEGMACGGLAIIPSALAGAKSDYPSRGILYLIPSFIRLLVIFHLCIEIAKQYTPR